MPVGNQILLNKPQQSEATDRISANESRGS